MYNDYEGHSSLPLALKGLFALVIVGAAIYCIFLFVTRLRSRKLKFTLTDILKFIWMVVSVGILLFMVSLFFPDFSFDEANRKFSELLPFNKGLLGTLTGLVAAFLITIFCIAGIGTYFSNPNKDKI